MNKIDDSRITHHDKADNIIDNRSDISSTSAPIYISKDQQQNLQSFLDLDYDSKK